MKKCSLQRVSHQELSQKMNRKKMVEMMRRRRRKMMKRRKKRNHYRMREKSVEMDTEVKFEEGRANC